MMLKSVLAAPFLSLAMGILFCNVTYSASKDQGADISILIERLKKGTALEKEASLDFFMKSYPLEMVPEVIESILDSTQLPRHGDTGWGNVYHQAATAMSKFAQFHDGLSQKERGYKDFSFWDDSGTATEQHRKEVRLNWLKWWQKNRKNIKSFPAHQ